MLPRDLIDAAEAALLARGAERTDPPIIQPAAPFLDTAGEDLRRRIFMTASETGKALCLRPEFTIPVCRDHIAHNGTAPHRYAVLGQVFRQGRAGSDEFWQAGIEDLGHADPVAADARCLADAWHVVAALQPDRALTATLGDHAVFEEILICLGLPEGWRGRLVRAFGRQESLDKALSVLADDTPQSPGADRTVAELAAKGDRDGLIAYVNEAMVLASISPRAGRTPAEIADRLLEQARLSATRLSADVMEALRRFIDIETPLAEAPAVLNEFVATVGGVAGQHLDRFAARVEAIRLSGLPLDAITYDAAFGRPIDYYTGMVFELLPADADTAEPLAVGGRYDRLLTLLGARAPTPGVGFSVRLDRIAALGSDGGQPA